MRRENRSKRHPSLTAEFPLAKLRGPISTELTEIWEAKFGASESQALPLYEKVSAILIYFCIHIPLFRLLTTIFSCGNH